jgi:hypothetical protein
VAWFGAGKIELLKAAGILFPTTVVPAVDEAEEEEDEDQEDQDQDQEEQNEQREEEDVHPTRQACQGRKVGTTAWRTFASQKAAAKFWGLDASSVGKVIRGQQAHTKDYEFNRDNPQVCAGRGHS